MHAANLDKDAALHVAKHYLQGAAHNALSGGADVPIAHALEEARSIFGPPEDMPLHDTTELSGGGFFSNLLSGAKKFVVDKALPAAKKFVDDKVRPEFENKLNWVADKVAPHAQQIFDHQNDKLANLVSGMLGNTQRGSLVSAVEAQLPHLQQLAQQVAREAELRRAAEAEQHAAARAREAEAAAAEANARAASAAAAEAEALRTQAAAAKAAHMPRLQHASTHAAVSADHTKNVAKKAAKAMAAGSHRAEPKSLAELIRKPPTRARAHAHHKPVASAIPHRRRGGFVEGGFVEDNIAQYALEDIEDDARHALAHLKLEDGSPHGGGLFSGIPILGSIFG